MMGYIGGQRKICDFFVRVLWPDREHCADYAASSTMLRGRKPSLEVLTWLQRKSPVRLM